MVLKSYFSHFAMTRVNELISHSDALANAEGVSLQSIFRNNCNLAASVSTYHDKLGVSDKYSISEQGVLHVGVSRRTRTVSNELEFNRIQSVNEGTTREEHNVLIKPVLSK